MPSIGNTPCSSPYGSFIHSRWPPRPCVVIPMRPRSSCQQISKHRSSALKASKGGHKNVTGGLKGAGWQWTAAGPNTGAGAEPDGPAGLLLRIAKPIALGVLVSALAASPMLPQVMAPTAEAGDLVKVGGCLLRKCQLQLAECLADVQCLENVVCLNACSGDPDETGCQIRCGDLYGDKAVDVFNSCAVSEQKCVPQRVDEGLYPVPADCTMDTSFDLNNFQGRWFITAGLNPLFDIFDCQEHFFALQEPGKLAARINWRIPKPNGDFIERSTIQTFIPDSAQPSHLINHGNEYLHYEDDWYILASKPDSYVVVYYTGNNDAWKGYGGAVVYTKARQLPQELVPELTAAVDKMGLKWSDFKVTDNTCGPHPPPKTLAQEVRGEAQELVGDLKSFGRGFTVLERTLEGDVQAVEKVLEEELKAAEKVLVQVEKQVAAEEAAVENQFSKVLGRFFGK